MPDLKLFINRLRLWELKRFVKKDDFALLDLGCGDGCFVNLANKNGVAAIGVDKSAPASSGLISSSIEDFEPNQKFDAVTLFHVLEHLQSPGLVLEKMATLLKEGGVLVVEVPLIGSLTERVLGRDYFAYRDPSHLHFFTKNKFLDLLREAGWRVEKKGFTLLEFPLTLVTTGFKKSYRAGLIGIILFLPFKFLSIMGLNEEIIRVYCRRK